MKFRIRELRLSAGMSQAQLEKRAGISHMTLVALESKRPYTTTTRTLEKIADVFGVRPQDLFFDQT